MGLLDKVNLDSLAAELSGINFDENPTPGGSSEEETGSHIASAKVPWGQLHQEILEAWLVDEDEWAGPAMQALAKRLRTPVEDFAYAMEEVGSEEISIRRAERLLEAERIRNKDINWDRLEEAVLGKLMTHVKTSKNLKTGELLAIAQTANRATRKTGGTPVGGPNINIQMNGGSEQQVSLPGAGNLGTMTLTLTPKTIQQLSQGITIDGEAEKFSDSIEMLGGEDLKELNKLAGDK